MTTRRGFLAAALASAAAAFALDPEKALWVPGKKRITFGRAPIPVHFQNLWSIFEDRLLTRLSVCHGEELLAIDLMRDSVCLAPWEPPPLMTAFELPQRASLKLPPIAMHAALNALRAEAKQRGFPPLGEVIASTLYGAQF